MTIICRRAGRAGRRWAAPGGLTTKIHLAADRRCRPVARILSLGQHGDCPRFILWYSGKAHTHGGNIQAVLAPDGFPLWISDMEPGSVHDLTAARIHALPGLYHAAATADLPTLADPGYDGAGIGIHIEIVPT